MFSLLRCSRLHLVGTGPRTISFAGYMLQNKNDDFPPKTTVIDLDYFFDEKAASEPGDLKTQLKRLSRLQERKRKEKKYTLLNRNKSSRNIEDSSLNKAMEGAQFWFPSENKATALKKVATNEKTDGQQFDEKKQRSDQQTAFSEKEHPEHHEDASVPDTLAMSDIAGSLGESEEDCSEKVEQETFSLVNDKRKVSKLMKILVDDTDSGNLAGQEMVLKSLLGAMGRTSIVRDDDINDKVAKHVYSNASKKRRPRNVHFSLTEGESTDLFSTVSTSEPSLESSCGLFEREWNKDLSSLIPEVTPENKFELSMLTIDKQWNFPIDNQQDMGVEEETSFDSHVFLDHWLDEFPDVEPVQRFMELVITGLQKNPFLTVEAKEKRILWFKNYFEKFPQDDWKLEL